MISTLLTVLFPGLLFDMMESSHHVMPTVGSVIHSTYSIHFIMHLFGGCTA